MPQLTILEHTSQSAALDANELMKKVELLETKVAESDKKFRVAMAAFKGLQAFVRPPLRAWQLVREALGEEKANRLLLALVMEQDEQDRKRETAK